MTTPTYFEHAYGIEAYNGIEWRLLRTGITPSKDRTEAVLERVIKDCPNHGFLDLRVAPLTITRRQDTE